jgi:hypothetical protein
MAACHHDAVPCVLRNEGKKLFQMFQSLFTITALHTANLPSVRKQFYDVAQKDTESALQYTARVDIIVATMAKLGEQISPGAWIHALGNGLRPEYKDTKDGILYSKDGYSSVILVKSKIMCEEAILKDKRESIKKEQLSKQSLDDEIALKVEASKPKPHKTKPVIVDLSQISKGKDGKKGGPRGQRQWNDRSSSDESWNTSDTLQQSQPPWPLASPPVEWQQPKGNAWPSKGKGKQSNRSKLWCDIHQAYGHSTDWCFSNPNKSGGPPKLEWCNHHQMYGHSTEECRKGNGATSPAPQQKGSTPPTKGGKGKSKGPNRAWKSDNFPANYDQATPVLQEDYQPEWWETDVELSSVCVQDFFLILHQRPSWMEMNLTRTLPIF